MEPSLTHATSWRSAEAGATYERGRPDYPPGAVAALAERLGLRAGATVADLAAGTGKLTRSLVATGARVLAVEPAPGMLAQLPRRAPGALVLAGRAEHLPVPAGSLDAVTVAQAFHWFEAEAAIAEIHRALRPGGTLAVVYNDRDTRQGWVGRMSEILGRYERLAPRPSAVTRWPQAFAASDRFSPFEQLEFHQVHRIAADVFEDRIGSMSFVILLPDEARMRLMAELRALVEGQDPVLMPLRTRVLLAARWP